jgi:hypothetical protein
MDFVLLTRVGARQLLYTADFGSHVIAKLKSAVDNTTDPLSGET